MPLPTIQIEKDLEMPMLGFGTWHSFFFKATHVVRDAIRAGFRHIDTAPAYLNLPFVGRGINTSGVPRDQLFVTSKLWPPNFANNKVVRACKSTLWRTSQDYFDLFLLHWPNQTVPAEETFGEMIRLKEMGLVRSVGVSNHTITHLQYLLDKGLKPSVNQVEFHPSLYQKELLEFCQTNGITLVAHSPLASGHELRLPAIREAAKKYGQSPASVVFNWILSKGVGAIPSTDNPRHMADNLKAADWKMQEEDIAKIDAENSDYRVIISKWAEF